MRLQPTRPTAGRPKGLSALSLAAATLVAGCLGLGTATLLAADGGGPMNAGAGGGDAIGSLPFNASPPPESLNGTPTPSIVLEGPSLAAILLVVVDAWGDGYAESCTTEVGVRVELQGDVHLLVDRNRLQHASVRFGLDVSQGFSGGLGVLTQNTQVMGTQILPAQGDLLIPLAALSTSGLLDVGGLTFHSLNFERKHHALDLTGSGGTLHLSTHE